MEDFLEMESRLWAYIDGFCNEGERSAIEQLLEEQKEWRIKYQELLMVHQSLQLSELEEPSLRFTKNVMEEISKMQIAPATKKYINEKIIWGIGLFFIAMLAGFIIYGTAQIDWSVATDNKGFLGINVEKIDFSKMFSSNLFNGIMMLNVVLGLFLLDRYLANKKKGLLKEL